MVEAQIVLNRTEKPNSFEFGKPSCRHKIYYDRPEDLQKHIDVLKQLGLYTELNLQEAK